MSFLKGTFFLFFPAVLVLYHALPGRFRALWLLLSSLCFYYLVNPAFVPVLLCYIAFTFGAGLLLEKHRAASQAESGAGSDTESGIQSKAGGAGSAAERRAGTALLAACLVALFSILLVFKYLPKGPFLIMPAGLSFFTFEAAGYLIDVYKGREAEKNPVILALFLSFFPQLLSGPIARAESLLPQLNRLKEERPSLKRSLPALYSGFFLLLWGYFLKLVAADRAALFVDKVFGDFPNYPGTVVFVSALLYVLQLYCDFFGYTTIAAGAAEMLGIKLEDNFGAPFFASSFGEFWRRWHRSLTGWFRDYLYFPLGGSRKGQLRKYVNMLIVFTVSGIWHGNSLNFAVWGLLNGVLLVWSDWTMPFRKKLCGLLKLDPASFSHRLFSSLVVLLEFTLGTVFFRAPSVGEALRILKHMALHPGIRAFQQSLFFAEGEAMPGARDVRILLFALGVLLWADWQKYRGKRVRDWIFAQEAWFRDALIIAAPLLILFLGIWGEAFTSSSFVYVHF